MSNAKDHGGASQVRELFRKKDAAAETQTPRAMDHPAVAILAANGAEVKDILAALADLRQAFVDWNEVRVARVQEIARHLGNIPGAEASAKAIREEYNAFFDKKGSLGFDFLANGKPSESRRALAQILPKLCKGAQSILLYEFCPGAQLPLSDEGLRAARRDGAIGKNGDRGQLAKILADALPLADAARLLEHWEMEATGSPYGEALKKDGGSGKKPRKNAKTK